MPLPFKDPDVKLPSNRKDILLRTEKTLGRLRKDPDKLQTCLKSMQKSLNAGHVERIPYNDLKVEAGRAWCIPILPVTTTKKNKTRLVFDSSTRYLSLIHI